MKLILGEIAYNFALASHGGILSNNRASVLDIADGEVYTNGPGTFIITSPVLPGGSQVAWGNAKLYLTLKRFSPCTVKLGVSNGTSFSGDAIAEGGNLAYLASKDINAVAINASIKTQMYPAMEITTSAPGLFLALYDFKCYWLTTELNCNG